MYRPQRGGKAGHHRLRQGVSLRGPHPLPGPQAQGSHVDKTGVMVAIHPESPARAPPAQGESAWRDPEPPPSFGGPLWGLQGRVTGTPWRCRQVRYRAFLGAALGVWMARGVQRTQVSQVPRVPTVFHRPHSHPNLTQDPALPFHPHPTFQEQSPPPSVTSSELHRTSQGGRGREDGTRVTARELRLRRSSDLSKVR